MKTLTPIKPKNYSVRQLNDELAKVIHSKYASDTLKSYVPLVYTVNAPVVYEQYISCNLNVMLNHMLGKRASYTNILNKRGIYTGANKRPLLWHTDIAKYVDYSWKTLLFERTMQGSKTTAVDAYASKALRRNESATYPVFQKYASHVARFAVNRNTEYTAKPIGSVYSSRTNKLNLPQIYALTHVSDSFLKSAFAAVNTGQSCMLRTDIRQMSTDLSQYFNANVGRTLDVFTSEMCKRNLLHTVNSESKTYKHYDSISNFGSAFFDRTVTDVLKYQPYELKYKNGVSLWTIDKELGPAAKAKDTLSFMYQINKQFLALHSEIKYASDLLFKSYRTDEYAKGRNLILKSAVSQVRQNLRIASGRYMSELSFINGPEKLMSELFNYRVAYGDLFATVISNNQMYKHVNRVDRFRLAVLSNADKHKYTASKSIITAAPFKTNSHEINNHSYLSKNVQHASYSMGMTVHKVNLHKPDNNNDLYSYLYSELNCLIQGSTHLNRNLILHSSMLLAKYVTNHLSKVKRTFLPYKSNLVNKNIFRRNQTGTDKSIINSAYSKTYKQIFNTQLWGNMLIEADSVEGKLNVHTDVLDFINNICTSRALVNMELDSDEKTKNILQMLLKYKSTHVLTRNLIKDVEFKGFWSTTKKNTSESITHFYDTYKNQSSANALSEVQYIAANMHVGLNQYAHNQQSNGFSQNSRDIMVNLRRYSNVAMQGAVMVKRDKLKFVDNVIQHELSLIKKYSYANNVNVGYPDSSTGTDSVYKSFLNMYNISNKHENEYYVNRFAVEMSAVDNISKYKHMRWLSKDLRTSLQLLSRFLINKHEAYNTSYRTGDYSYNYNNLYAPARTVLLKQMRMHDNMLKTSNHHNINALIRYVYKSNGTHKGGRRFYEKIQNLYKKITLNADKTLKVDLKKLIAMCNVYSKYAHSDMHNIYKSVYSKVLSLISHVHTDYAVHRRQRHVDSHKLGDYTYGYNINALKNVIRVGYFKPTDGASKQYNRSFSDLHAINSLIQMLSRKNYSYDFINSKNNVYEQPRSTNNIHSLLIKKNRDSSYQIKDYFNYDKQAYDLNEWQSAYNFNIQGPGNSAVDMAISANIKSLFNRVNVLCKNIRPRYLRMISSIADKEVLKKYDSLTALHFGTYSNGRITDYSSNFFSNHPYAGLIYRAGYDIFNTKSFGMRERLNNLMNGKGLESNYLAYQRQYINRMRMSDGKLSKLFKSVFKQQTNQRDISQNRSGRVELNISELTHSDRYKNLYQVWRAEPKSVSFNVKQLKTFIANEAIKQAYRMRSYGLTAATGLRNSWHEDNISKFTVTNVAQGPQFNKRGSAYLNYRYDNTHESPYSFAVRRQENIYSPFIGSDRQIKVLRNYAHVSINRLDNKSMLSKPERKDMLVLRNVGVNRLNVNNDGSYVSNAFNYPYAPDMNYMILQSNSNNSAQPEFNQYRESAMVFKQDNSSDIMVKTIDIKKLELEKEINKKLEYLEKKIDDKSLSVKSVSDRVYSRLMQDLRVDRQRRGN